MYDEYEDYYFDDAIGNTSGNEYGYSGNQSNYDSSYDDWENQQYIGNSNYQPNELTQINTDYQSQTPGYNPQFDAMGSEDMWGSYGYNPQQGQPGMVTLPDGTRMWQGANGQWAGYQNPNEQFTPYQNQADVGGKPWYEIAASGAKDFLGKIFADPKSLMAVGAAGLTGRQNKQRAQAAQNIVTQQQQKMVAPFDAPNLRAQQLLGANNAREAAINEYIQSLKDPYASPMVSNQVKAMQEAQRIKDAKAGRRSNDILGNTQILGEQAKIAQNYQDQLARQAGMNFNNSGQIGQLGLAQLIAGANQGIDGYISPLANALGYGTQSAYNSANRQDLMDALEKLLKDRG